MAEADEVSVAGSLSDETESIQSVLEEESVHPLYFLVQWEDRFMSVIHPKDIVTPKKTIYVEGELIEAKYQTKTTTKIYKAVISEISDNRKFLLQQAKLPPKHTYAEAKNSEEINTWSRLSQNALNTCTTKKAPAKRTAPPPKSTAPKLTKRTAPKSTNSTAPQPKPKKSTDKELQQKSATVAGVKLFEKLRYVTRDELDFILDAYLRKSEFRRFKKKLDKGELNVADNRPTGDLELEDIIRSQKGPYEAVEAGLLHLFTLDEIKSHSATGKNQIRT